MGISIETLTLGASPAEIREIRPDMALRDMRVHSKRTLLETLLQKADGSLLDDELGDLFDMTVKRQITRVRYNGGEVLLLEVERWILSDGEKARALGNLAYSFSKQGTLRFLSPELDVPCPAVGRLFEIWQEQFHIDAKLIPWSYLGYLESGQTTLDEVLGISSNGNSQPVKPVEPKPSDTGVPANIKTVRIFLASSAELREDRDAFDLYFRQQNDQLRKQGLYLEIVRWENFLDAMSSTRLQDEYNQAILRCDIFVSLFMTKTGKYTEEEFDLAFETFKATGKPLVYTFFKKFTISPDASLREDLVSLWDFQKKLVDQHKHFYTEYDSIESLKRQFKDQLEKLRIEHRL
ncbi:MAG: hypothetical protein ABW076_15640 [Candidatus Thiodiazotropha sp.]